MKMEKREEGKVNYAAQLKQKPPEKITLAGGQKTGKIERTSEALLKQKVSNQDVQPVHVGNPTVDSSSNGLGAGIVKKRKRFQAPFAKKDVSLEEQYD